MELTIQNAAGKIVGIADDYHSAIWTERAHAAGDFELYIPMSSGLTEKYKPELFLYRRGSTTAMIIEDQDLTTSEEDGDFLKVTGRCLKSVLDRRVLWSQYDFSGSMQTALQTILNANAINPTDTARKIANLTFQVSPESAVTGKTGNFQFEAGANLYDIFLETVEAFGLWWTVTWAESGIMRVRIEPVYSTGEIFSPRFDTLESSERLYSTRSLRNVARVGGEGEGSAKKMTQVLGSGAGTGLLRREMYVDASDISSSIDGRTLSATEYTNRMAEKGKKELANNLITNIFSGSIDELAASRKALLGYATTVESAYGDTASVMVTEITHTHTADEYKSYPTFTSL